MTRRLVLIWCLLALVGPAWAQRPAGRGGQRLRAGAATSPVALKPARVFDGTVAEAHEGWIVVVRGQTIEAAGPAGEVKVPEDARVIDLPGTTLLPGLIDAHTHVLLHPYNEALWDDQVLKEALALWVCRATNHLRSTLLSGFTTIRDLGTEGAGYADVGLKQAVDQGIVPGPRMLVVTRAIVATGSYAPKGFAPELRIHQGAEEADGVDSLIRVVRDQIGKGADWIKVYADAAMGGAAVRPSFSVEELTRIVETAGSTGVPVSAHAMSKEGMRRGDRGGRRHHRARLRRRSGGLQADGRAGRRPLPDLGRHRSVGHLSRLSPGKRPRASQHQEAARDLQAGARGGRHDRQRQRHGGLRPR